MNSPYLKYVKIQICFILSFITLLSVGINAYATGGDLAVEAAAIAGDLIVPNNLIIYEDGYYSLDGGNTISTDTLGPETQIKKASGNMTIELRNTTEVYAKLISLQSGSLTVSGGGKLTVNNPDITEMSRISGIRIYNGGLTVTDGTNLTVTGVNGGVYVVSAFDLLVTDGSVLTGKATGTNSAITGADKYGIYSYGRIVVSNGGSIWGIGGVPSYNTYGLMAYAGYDVTDGEISGLGNVGVYANRNGPIKVNSGGKITGVGGSYSTSHGVQADYTSIVVNTGGELTGSCGGYAGVQASAGGITVAGGKLAGITTGMGYDQYGVHVSGANDFVVSDGGEIVGTGFYNGVYTNGGNMSVTGGGKIEGHAHTYGYYSTSFGYYGAIIAKVGTLSADGSSKIIENYVKVEDYDEVFVLPYQNGKNMTDYLNYSWTISSGTGAVESDPGGSGIRATESGTGTLTALRTGGVAGEVVTLDTDSSHIINIPVNLTVIPVEVPYYTVTYDPNGATGGNVPIDDHQYLPEEQVDVKGNEGGLQKTDHTFVGWTLTPDGSGTVYNTGDTIVMADANIILYAKWEPVQLPPEEENPTTGGAQFLTCQFCEFSS